MFVVLKQLDRFGAGQTDFREQEVAVAPDTIHRLVPGDEVGEGQKTTTATMTDGGTLTLLGSVRELVETINELYLRMIQ